MTIFIEDTVSATTTYINPKIIANASESILQKLLESEPIFFTVSVEDFKIILLKAIKKDSGHRFDNCEPYFIPNSYIEIHVENSISVLADRVAFQIRKRKDDRGLNIFVTNSDNENFHDIIFPHSLPDKEEYYNELHLKTQEFNNDLHISIQPK